MPQKLSALATGAKIKYLTLFGAKVVWRVIGRNLPDMPSDSTTIFMDKINALLPFDAKEPQNSDSNRKSYGNNEWGVSNLRQWANSPASAGNWYSAQHSADAPPTAANVWVSGSTAVNPYQDKPGMLYESTQEERDLALATTRKYTSYQGSPLTSVDKFFPLSTVELGLETIANNGTKIPYFTDNNSRITQCTAQCIAQSNYPSNPATSTNWYYWCINPYPSYSYNVRYVNAEGSLNSNNAYNGSDGVRLGCNLPSSILVSDSTDADGCYTIIYNQPPTAPKTITVPSTIRATKSFKVQWDAGTDPEGQLEGYALQRKLDGGEWGQVYRGSSREYTDTLAYGTTSAQYRVQSYDRDGATSGWTTSMSVTVINNRPPVINLSPIDHEIVETMTAPKLSYTVTDEDGDEVTVEEYLDDEKLKSFTAELGHTYEVTVDAAKWVTVLNGTHAYKVVAKDSQGDSASNQATFTKKVSTVDFTMTTPFNADDRPTQAVVNVAGVIPPEATFKLELSNNGLDEEPAWVDATDEARNGTKVFFQNETKTNDKWGLGIRCHLDRGTAEGDCYIVAIGGNFA